MPRGRPQIEVTYDIDANGILNVSAVEKSTGKENKITITNDKGRLSKEDIERMVEEAETYKAEDEANTQRIQAKNELENLAYTIQSTLNDDKLKDKLDSSDRETVASACKDTIDWLDTHQDEDKETYDTKKSTLEGVWQPVMQKLYAAGDGGGMGGEDASVGGDDAPSIEVD